MKPSAELADLFWRVACFFAILSLLAHPFVGNKTLAIGYGISGFFLVLSAAIGISDIVMTEREIKKRMEEENESRN